MIAYINHYGQRVCKCSVCGYQSVWQPSWSWYGSLRDEDDGKPVDAVCSDGCKAKYKPALKEKRS